MFRERAVPWLAKLREGVIHSRVVRIFGMGESEVESILRTRMNQLVNPTLAPYAKEGEVELRITAKAADLAKAEELYRPGGGRYGGFWAAGCMGTDVPNLEQVVLDGLKYRKLTLGTAESCTGGLIAKRLTDLPGASAANEG